MKPMYATVANRGQVTIPVYIRNKQRLSSGNMVEFVAMENSFIAIPINNSIKDLSGIL
ncbi:MAG: AbrB/MazE/SpoVT family DNA-binding domain-containing protein [Rickettsiaceae bacterium]|nr:AbrB/MazE/SpoVT family DNA-binding domain-containing protein [Rickettsiaceae bacterium]